MNVGATSCVRRTVVTGSSGFVGAAIARAALDAGHEVAGIARSGGGPASCLTQSFEPAALVQALRDFKPAIVIHAAGLPSVAATQADPQTGYNATVVPFRNLVEAIETADLACTLIYVSSAAVYGNPAHLPVGESAPLLPISVYGHHRIECEALARGLATRRGLATYAVRTFSLFGAAQRRLLVWELFHRISHDDIVTIGGTGNEMRDYIDIETFARNVLALASHRSPGFAAINVASGIGTTVRGLAELMLDVLGIDKPIHCEGRTSPYDPLRWQADIARLRAITGWEGAYDLRRSIAATVEAWR